MRLALLSLVATVLAKNAAVYKNVDCDVEHWGQVLSLQDSILNLADDIGIAPFYNVQEADRLSSLSIGKCTNAETLYSANELIIVINGVENPQDFFNGGAEAVYEIDIVDDRQANKFKKFLNGISSKLSQLEKGNGFNLAKLSNEITLFTKNKATHLEKIWDRYFHDDEGTKVEKIWSELKQSLVGVSSNDNDDSAFILNKRSLNHINDESFIKELAQLDFFLNDKAESLIEGDKTFIYLDSLVAVYKKTGASATYEVCQRVMSELISDKLSHFNTKTTIIALPINQELMTLKQESAASAKSALGKRDNSAQVNLFKSVGAGCFKSEEACIDSTDSCSSHGVCLNNGGCWQCVCSATKENKSTTHWTGSSCEKIDYSSQFNLLFWTTLVLFAAIISGVKLMYGCGKEDLPGVLLAATIQTKKST
ncbi:hypothetical protein DAMA08_024700 [Martiniozyma asiatica (nom. inval.)]|nr:hypothetical protein DAMA08_024700 [Martiniozyma asiatica]